MPTGRDVLLIDVLSILAGRVLPGGDTDRVLDLMEWLSVDSPATEVRRQHPALARCVPHMPGGAARPGNGLPWLRWITAMEHEFGTTLPLRRADDRPRRAPLLDWS